MRPESKQELVVIPDGARGCCGRKLGYMRFQDAFSAAFRMANRRTYPGRKIWVYLCKAGTGRFHIGNKTLRLPPETWALAKRCAGLEAEVNRLRKLTRSRA